MYVYDALRLGCYAGWRRYEGNPVIGNELGECFDVFVLPDTEGYRMYFSWRSRKSIAVSFSKDGFSWDPPRIVLAPEASTGWEDDVNRMCLLKKDGRYHMWYSGQTQGSLRDNSGTSRLGYAVSDDGLEWERYSTRPVFEAENEWEQQSIMCPHVLWDEEAGIYRMYYSAGGWFEPDAIGYAESSDGISWKRKPEPIFWPVYKNLWERERTTACQVLRHGDWYYMFYIGFEDVHKARVCFARSRNGIDGWERHPLNPIICPGEASAWDCEAMYKPFLVYEKENRRWLMWVNGRRAFIEQIGVMIHDGEDLGFDDPIPKTRFER